MTDIPLHTTASEWSTFVWSLEFDDPDLWESIRVDGQPTGGVDASGEDHQTSSGAPSSQPAVVANGAPEDGLTAAFKAEEHPRGKDGKFIKKGVGLPDVVFDALGLLKKVHGDIEELSSSEKDDFVGGLPDITPKQWANLKDEDKEHLTKFAEDALEEGVPGSATALTHLEDLEQGGDQDETPDVFSPDTELSTLGKVTPKTQGKWGPFTYGPEEDVQVDYGTLAKYSNDEYNAAGYKHETIPVNMLIPTQHQDDFDGDVGGDGGIGDPFVLVKDGQFFLIDGHHRAQKAGKNGTIKAWVYDVDDPPKPKSHTPINTPTKTVAKATPIKMTHGLIHAKHTPGEIIAQTKFDGVSHRLKWNGKEYEVQWNKGGAWSTHQIVKKSGLYTWTAKNFPNAQWTKPGKQNVEVNVPSVNVPSVPHPLKDVPSASPGESTPFTIVKNKGQSGDGFVAPGVWGKYGAAGVMIRAKGDDGQYRYLLVQRGKGYDSELKWQLPGGAIDELETPEQGAAREIFEEIGAPESYLKTMVHKGTHAVNVDIGKDKPWTYSNIAADAPTQFKPKIDGTETADAKWLTKDEIQQMLHNGELHSPFANQLDQVFGLWGGSQDNETTVDVPNTPDLVPEPLGKPLDDQAPYVAQAQLLSQFKKGLLTVDEYESLSGLKAPSTGPSSPLPSESSPDYTSVETLFQGIKTDLYAGKYSPGDVIATGKSDKHPNAEYRLIVDTQGQPVFEYKTPNFDWKANATPQTFDKVNVEWTVNAPSSSVTPTSVAPSVTVPTTPAAGVSAVPHLSEDIISYWPGVGGASYKPGQVVAHSIDGKWTLKKSDTDSNFFTVVDQKGDDYASFSTLDVKLGYVKDVAPGVDWVVPSKASGASSLNAPSPTGSAPSVGIGHLTHTQKSTFYTHFKDEKVSPAWSGAKIYNSLQVAKTKMAGDPQIAALTDDQMLDLVDDQLKLKAPAGHYTPNAHPFKDKVVAWLKTPNGKKAALAGKLGGWASGHASVPAKKAVKSAAKATSGTPSPPIGSGMHVTPNLMDDVTPAQLSAFYKKFKSKGFGTSISGAPVDQVYANALMIARESHAANGDAHVGKELTAGDVLRLMDEETKKLNPGSESTYAIYESKVTDWLKTPSGAKKSAEIQKNVAAGTYKPTVSKKTSYPSYTGTYGSSYSGSYTHSASKPYSEKVQLKGSGIEPYDPSKGPSDFPPVSTAQGAKLWSDMEEAGGGPITTGQKSSLKYYTSSAGYSAMNGYLRGKTGATDTTQNHITKAQDGMRPLTQDVTLYRGAGFFTGWGSYEEIKAREGTVWHEPAFFSASVGSKSAFGGSIGYIIEAPKGTPGAFVKAFSHYGSENELFLAAGLKYQVISVEKKGTPTTSGSHVTVRLRVVPDSTPSLNIVASGKVGV